MNAADPNAFAIELAGRRYPRLAASERSSTPARSLREPIGKPPLADRFVAATQATLPWRDLAANPDRAELCRRYSETLRGLARRQRELQTLLERMCGLNLTFRQLAGITHEGAREEVLTRQREELVQKTVHDWPPLRSVLDARVASLPLDQLRATLDASVRAATDEFAPAACELLARLVDEEFLGIVEWLPDRCCAYHYFQRVVLQENQGASTRVERSSINLGGVRGVRERVAKVRGEGRHLFRCARHEHTLIHALRATLGNTPVELPPAIVQVVRDLPAWLAGLLEVVSGDLVRHRTIERDLGEEAWGDESVTVVDRPVFAFDPALVIGSFVLTGWVPVSTEAN